ncbi:hypothetical protein [Nocardia cyriacigeorgica]|nr:hypothetical protein [Nocardia cyriacigeorgica]
MAMEISSPEDTLKQVLLSAPDYDITDPLYMPVNHPIETND